MTKRGKEIKLSVSDNFNVVYGTVDNKNIRALYINISAWGEPTSDQELNYNRIINKLNKCMKQHLFNAISEKYPDVFFSEKTILDLDMRESGIRYGKRSFMNCEVTLFIKNHNNLVITNESLYETLDDVITNSIICLEDFEHFKFYQTKN